MTTTLQSRAKFYARILIELFTQQKLAGFKLREANRAARHLSLGIQLLNPQDLKPALSLAENLALSSNCNTVIAQRDRGLIYYQFQLSSGFWQEYTRQDLLDDKAIGLGECRRPVLFQFSDTEPHALVAGITGSGKTETIKSILISLANVFKPNELKFAVCDPNNWLSDFNNSSHLAMPIAVDNEDMRQVLVFCQQELIKRKRQNNTDNYRLVLVLDEATETLLTQTDLQIVKQLSKQGRGFKINILLGTQKPNQADLPGIIDQLPNRFVGKVTDARTSTLLTGHAGLMAHKLTGKGDFLHVVNGDGKRFQVAQATRIDFDRLPRGGVSKPVIEPDEIVFLPDKQVGRPALQVQPDILAHYWHYGPGNISIAMAKKLLGLSRDGHNLHKQFCYDFGKMVLQLRGG